MQGQALSSRATLITVFIHFIALFISLYLVSTMYEFSFVARRNSADLTAWISDDSQFTRKELGLRLTAGKSPLSPVLSTVPIHQSSLGYEISTILSPSAKLTSFPSPAS